MNCNYRENRSEQAYLDELIAERDRANGAYYCNGREKCIGEWKAIQDEYIQTMEEIYDFFRYSIDQNSLNLTVFFKSNRTEDKKWTESCELTEPPTTELATVNP